MSVFKKFAVIGSPIDHSLSPKIHSIFARKLGIEITYEAIEVEPMHFDSSVNRLFDEGYAGLNVTLPLKELAFNFADELTEDSIYLDQLIRSGKKMALFMVTVQTEEVWLEIYSKRKSILKIRK